SSAFAKRRRRRGCAGAPGTMPARELEPPKVVQLRAADAVAGGKTTGEVSVAAVSVTGDDPADDPDAPQAAIRPAASASIATGSRTRLTAAILDRQDRQRVSDCLPEPTSIRRTAPFGPRRINLYDLSASLSICKRPTRSRART